MDDELWRWPGAVQEFGPDGDQVLVRLPFERKTGPEPRMDEDRMGRVDQDRQAAQEFDMLFRNARAQKARQFCL